MNFLQFLAEDMEKIWYHGTNKNFDQFKPKISKGAQLGFGIHFTSDPKFADLYANRKVGANIRSVHLTCRKTLDVDRIFDIEKDADVYKLAQELYKRSKFRFLPMDGQFCISLDVASSPYVDKLLRKYGYDSVCYVAKYGSYGTAPTHQAEAMVVLDPSQIHPISISRK